MHRPLVSVVVTCYNYERFLDACVISVLEQRYEPLELLIIDDGSTDGTKAVASKWLADPRVQYFCQDNQGQAVAKNVGVRAARGELVAFLDADDYWHPEKLAKQVPLFADEHVGVVYSRAKYVDEFGMEQDPGPEVSYLQPRRGNVQSWLLFDNFVPFSSSVVCRSVFTAAGGFDETLSMAIDWDLWLRLSASTHFDYVDEPLLLYRRGHEDQMSRKQAERLRCCDRIMAKFLASNPDVPEKVLRDATIYTCLTRGRYFERQSRRDAVKYYLKAIRLKPFQRPAYRGLLRVSFRVASRS